jgi:hypothetical protein
MAELSSPKCTRCGKTDQIVLVTPMYTEPAGEGWLQCERCRLRVGDYFTSKTATEIFRQCVNLSHEDAEEDAPHDKHKKGGHK